MAEIEVRVTGVADVLRRLNPAEQRRRAVGAMDESLSYLQGLVQGAMPVDKGFSRAAVITEVRGISVLGDLRGVVTHAPAITWMAVLEDGRAPGATRPPIAAIRDWVVRHGMPPEAAWPVATAIGRRGLRPHHMFANAARVGAATVERIWTRWLQR